MNLPLFVRYLLLLALPLSFSCAGRSTGATGDGPKVGLPKPRTEPAGKGGAQVPVAPTLTSIAELGTPVFALRVDLSAFAASAFVQATGVMDALSGKMMSEVPELQDKMSRCMGTDVSLLTNLITDISVFGSSQAEFAVLLGTVPTARRVVDCNLQNTESGRRVAKEMFGAVQGYRIVEKTGEVYHAVSVAEHALLLIIGEQKELVTRLRIGSGDLGRGDVSGYFGAGGHVVTLVSRNIELNKLIERSGGRIPKLQTGDLTGTLHLSDAIGLELTFDAKNPSAAESLAAFLVIMKGLSDVRQGWAGTGLDAKLLDEGLRIKAVGNEVRVKWAFDAVAAGKIATLLKPVIERQQEDEEEEDEEEAP